MVLNKGNIKEKIKYKENGITLIALIITIITLLILSGVTISLVISDNGVIKQTEQAKILQQETTDIQEITLAVSAEDLEVAMKGGTRERDNISAELLKKYDNVKVEWTTKLDVFKVTVDEREYKVDVYGEVTKWDDSVEVSLTKPNVEEPTTQTPIPTVVPTQTPHVHDDLCYAEHDHTYDCYLYECTRCGNIAENYYAGKCSGPLVCETETITENKIHTCITCTYLEKCTTTGADTCKEYITAEPPHDKYSCGTCLKFFNTNDKILNGNKKVKICGYE